MRLSSDEWVFWQYGFFSLNATIVFTWILMLVLVVASSIITRRLSSGLHRSRWQNLLEIIVMGILNQIEEIGLRESRTYLSFSARSSCSSPPPASARSFHGSNLLRDRFRRPQRSPSASWWPFHYSASKGGA